MLFRSTNIAELEQQFAKRNYSYTMYNQSYAVVANYISDRAQKKGAFVLGWVTGIVGTLILLVGLINFFHFLIGSFLNRTKEYSIMKMAGCNWKQQFCRWLRCTIVISLCGQGISCPSFLCLVDGVAFFYLILGRKKAGDLFQISCLVCRCVGGGYLVVKVRDKLTRCVGGKLELVNLYYL